MNEELKKCFEPLGYEPNLSFKEIKEVYREKGYE